MCDLSPGSPYPGPVYFPSKPGEGMAWSHGRPSDLSSYKYHAYLLGNLPVEPAWPSNVRVILSIDRHTCAGCTPDQEQGHWGPPSSVEGLGFHMEQPRPKNSSWPLTGQPPRPQKGSERKVGTFVLCTEEKCLGGPARALPPPRPPLVLSGWLAPAVMPRPRMKRQK